MMVPRPEALYAAISERMCKQHVVDMHTEMIVRNALFAAGIRYRKQWLVPGRRRRTIDIAIPARRLAIFIDGCFWYGCESHKTVPWSNKAWRHAKPPENKWRDDETTEMLVAQGLKVLRFWELGEPSDVVASVIHSITALDVGNG